jgi:hypothetical protein
MRPFLRSGVFICKGHSNIIVKSSDWEVFSVSLTHEGISFQNITG